MRSEKQKIDQLTSLRFFAAFMIVIHHSQGLFGIKPTGIGFDQGVSFFFVLSGFILTYVYPKLESPTKILLFWRARIARIWPAYFFGFLLVLGLIGGSVAGKTSLAYLLMVQAWIPYSKYYFSYNAVGWSVSTELFFYVMFPMLIYRWEQTWLLKFALSAATLLGLMLLSDVFALPDYGDPGKGQEGLLLSKHGLLYISPLARIFEFIFGMCTARFWQRTESGASFRRATVYELAALGGCGLSMYYMVRIAAEVTIPLLSPALSQWLVHAGSMFAFGLLIFVIAQGRGAISKILMLSPFVILGEISFSLYIIHQILINYYAANAKDFQRIPDVLAFILLCLILLFSSYLMWACIEMPGRRLIAGGRVHGTAVFEKTWRSRIFFDRRAVISAGALLVLIAGLSATTRNITSIDETAGGNITPPRLQQVIGTSFGGLFDLRGLDIESKPDGLHVDLAWRSDLNQNLAYTVAIHLVDASGAILGQADYKQSRTERRAGAGDIWLDTIVIPSDKITGNVTGLALALYKDAKQLPLSVDRGARDWGGRRLIIPIDPQP